jgi:hypothetical protein
MVTHKNAEIKIFLSLKIMIRKLSQKQFNNRTLEHVIIAEG